MRRQPPKGGHCQKPPDTAHCYYHGVNLDRQVRVGTGSFIIHLLSIQTLSATSWAALPGKSTERVSFSGSGSSQRHVCATMMARDAPSHPGTIQMHAVYLVCLVGGAVATALLVLVSYAGGLHGGHGLGGRHTGGARLHGHPVGHATTSGSHGHAHGVGRASAAGRARLSQASSWTLSWLSPLTVAAALLWFGGAGLIAESSLAGFAVLPAAVAALVGAFLLRSMMRLLVEAATPPLEQGAEGALATVNATIRPDAAGEVIYSVEGLTRSSPARSLDGMTIKRGESVAIVKSSQGIAWVAPLSEPEIKEVPERAAHALSPDNQQPSAVDSCQSSTHRHGRSAGRVTRRTS